MLPLECTVVSAKDFATGNRVDFETTDEGVVLKVGRVVDEVDHIVELVTK